MLSPLPRCALDLTHPCVWACVQGESHSMRQASRACPDSEKRMNEPMNTLQLFASTIFYSVAVAIITALIAEDQTALHGLSVASLHSRPVNSRSKCVQNLSRAHPVNSCARRTHGTSPAELCWCRRQGGKRAILMAARTRCLPVQCLQATDWYALHLCQHGRSISCLLKHSQRLRACCYRTMPLPISSTMYDFRTSVAQSSHYWDL